MYERWRFQRYLICLKMLKIRISIDKISIFILLFYKYWYFINTYSNFYIDEISILILIFNSRRDKKSFQYLFKKLLFKKKEE